jgi:aspartate/methionine/tyrosine aminotransferase
MRGARSRRSSAQARAAAPASRRQWPRTAARRRYVFPAGDYSSLEGGLADLNDVEFTERLINEAGVAVIPLSPFYREPPADMRIVRLCLAKRDETLTEAAARISAYTRAKRQKP